MIEEIRCYRCIGCKVLYPVDHGSPSGQCPLCRIKDRERQSQVIKLALLRPMDTCAPRDLVLDEWLETLEYFEGMCAYCRVHSYECLEHFIPTKLGGGTTVSNVVPSCLSCNKFKGSIHPSLITKIAQEDIERVRDYLQSKRVFA